MYVCMYVPRANVLPKGSRKHNIKEHGIVQYD